MVDGVKPSFPFSQRQFVFLLDGSDTYLKAHPAVKIIRLVAVAMFCVTTGPAQVPPAPALPRMMPQRISPLPELASTNAAVNYIIRVEWKDAKKPLTALQIISSEGRFSVDTVSGSVKINNSDVPTTVKLQATLTQLSPQKGRLQLFLGRTIPYVTSSFAGPGGNNSSSYSQLSVGMDSTFTVTFGKPLVIQMDDNGEVSILVKREE